MYLSYDAITDDDVIITWKVAVTCPNMPKCTILPDEFNLNIQFQTLEYALSKHYNIYTYVIRCVLLIRLQIRLCYFTIYNITTC